VQELMMSTLTVDLEDRTFPTTIERQCGFQPKRRARMSYQKGTIVRKSNGRFLLRYLVRCSEDPTRWTKKSELLDATTEKAAEKEKDRRMVEINAENEAGLEPGALSTRSMTFQEFTDGPWQDYLKRKGAASSTRRTYVSNLNRYILPIIGSMALDTIK